MGSIGTLLRQCAILVVLVALVVFAAPAEARLWVAITGTVALLFFVVVSIVRHREISRLALEVDEVLHSGRAVDFSNCREGDVAVLSNELAKMVSSLARTRDQLKDERNALADSLADISHQIRTPLTAATLMVPIIEDADGAIERKRYARQLETMLERVSWLVTTLLKIAKVDAGAMHVEHQPVKVEDVVRSAIEPLEAPMDLREVRLLLDVDDGAAFQGDGRWTAEAIENIVKNCMERTPAGGTVTVEGHEDALATAIVITDTGPGIAQEDLPHIFERFYRGNAGGSSSPNHIAETTDSREPSGFGIGLSLAQALVSAQEGTLSASNSPNGGACFEISFPKLVV